MPQGSLAWVLFGTGMEIDGNQVIAVEQFLAIVHGRSCRNQTVDRAAGAPASCRSPLAATFRPAGGHFDATTSLAAQAAGPGRGVVVVVKLMILLYFNPKVDWSLLRHADGGTFATTVPQEYPVWIDILSSDGLETAWPGRHGCQRD